MGIMRADVLSETWPEHSSTLGHVIKDFDNGIRLYIEENGDQAIDEDVMKFGIFLSVMLVFVFSLVAALRWMRFHLNAPSNVFKSMWLQIFKSSFQLRQS